MRPRLLRASYFLWVVVPLILYLGYRHYGLPHVIWSYTFTSPGGTYDPFADRIYYSCQFIGPYGAIDTGAHRGRCGWIRFFRKEEAG